MFDHVIASRDKLLTSRVHKHVLLLMHVLFCVVSRKHFVACAAASTSPLFRLVRCHVVKGRRPAAN